MRVAIVCSAHGFGHAGRQLALAEALGSAGHAVTVFSALPNGVAPTGVPGVVHRFWRVDVGLVQIDALREDVAATAARVDEVCAEARIDALAGELGPFDAAIVDVAPAGLEAARRAGVRALAVGNFDWAWIYGHFPSLGPWAARFAAWQAPHPGLSLWPGPGLRGFSDVRPGGLLGRVGRAVRVAPRSVLAAFGGFALDGLDALLPELPGVSWVLAPPTPRLVRSDVIWAADVPFPALLAGADAVLTKPGYGIFAECALAGTRIVHLPRTGFPEAPYLEHALARRGDHAAAPTREGVADAVRRALDAPPPAALRCTAAARVEAWLARGSP